MSMEAIISIISVCISLASTIAAGAAIVYSKKFKDVDLNQNNYHDIKQWYEETLKILKNLYLNHPDKMNKKELNSLLSDLSTQIDIGLLYFPNQKDGQYGLEKPEIFSGRRTLLLDVLIMYYDIFAQNKQKGNQDIIFKLQSIFSNEVTNVLKNNRTSSTFVPYTTVDKNEIFRIQNLENENFKKLLLTENVLDCVKNGHLYFNEETKMKNDTINYEQLLKIVKTRKQKKQNSKHNKIEEILSNNHKEQSR